MKRNRRRPLALHRETLRRLEPSAPDFRRVGGGRPRTTSDGDICSENLNCLTISGPGMACTFPMIVAPETPG